MSMDKSLLGIHFDGAAALRLHKNYNPNVLGGKLKCRWPPLHEEPMKSKAH